jgi:hypothetical protein
MEEITEDSSNLNISGTEITKLLGKKETQFFLKTDKMNLFVLEQLIDSTENFLLT